jgi:molybdate transport system ATP-binding protein
MSTIDVKINLLYDNFTLDAAFSVPARGITAILGVSGSGKSSLLRSIAGLEPEASGLVSISGDVWQNDYLFLAPHKRSVGLVPQQSCLFPHLNVYDNIRFAARYRTPDNFSLDEAIKLLGLCDILMRDPAKLSGGEQQRVAIARALASAPRVLLFDEPLSGLDEERKAELLPYLERLHRELSIPGLYVSHALAEAASVADHIVSLDKGRVMACGAVDDMLTGLVGESYLSHLENATAVLDTRVLSIDTDFELAHLGFSGGEFLVAATKLLPDDVVRIQVRARDVSIALSHSVDSSILNVLPAVIDEVLDDSQCQVVLRLLVGDQFILSRISRKSFVLLGLAKGLQVFAQVKSVALLG